MLDFGQAFDLDGKQSADIITKSAQPESLMKRTNEFFGVVSKALNASSNEPAYVRARHQAEESDQAYRLGVRRLDRQRLRLEEMLDDTLKLLQRWETERLRAVKTGGQIIFRLLCWYAYGGYCFCAMQFFCNIKAALRICGNRSKFVLTVLRHSLRLINLSRISRR